MELVVGGKKVKVPEAQVAKAISRLGGETEAIRKIFRRTADELAAKLKLDPSVVRTSGVSNVALGKTVTKLTGLQPGYEIWAGILARAFARNAVPPEISLIASRKPEENIRLPVLGAVGALVERGGRT